MNQRTINPPTAYLKRRWLRVLQLLAAGYQNKEIAVEMHVAEETVRWYLRRLYEHLGVRNRTQAVMAYHRLKERAIEREDAARSSEGSIAL